MLRDLLWMLLPLSALAIWGIVSPRSQWRILQAWLYRNPEANEPSDAAFAVQRFANAFALIGFGVIVFLYVTANTTSDDPSFTQDEAPTTSSPSAVEAVWGSGVDLVRPWDVETLETAPERNTLSGIAAFAPLDVEAEQPGYLWSGGIGTPDEVDDLKGHLIVGVDTLCDPSAIVVVETSETVSVGVQVLPTFARDGKAEEYVDSCRDVSDVGGVDLVAISLKSDLVGRNVIDLATGKELEERV